MTNRKNTKRALFSSVISLILCLSMLVGTTFAWFTDSVSSGVNQIVAGNLDVELYYGKAEDPTAQVLNNTSDIFTDENGNKILWEPGVVSYTNLKVANLGSLALKYQLAVNFINENNVNGYKLSQILKVGVVKGGIKNGAQGREAVIAQVEAWDDMVSFTQEGKLLPVGKTIPNAPADAVEGSETYGIVIWWEPSAEDNNWNVNNGKTTSDGQPLHIDLGINLVATQLVAEDDSFDNTYDEDADYLPAWDGKSVTPVALSEDGYYHITNGAELAYINTILAGLPAETPIKVVLDADINLGDEVWTPIGKDGDPFVGTFDGNGHTVYNVNVPAGTLATDNGDAGFFGMAQHSGAIKNLTLENVSVTGGERVGALIGKSLYVDILNCRVNNATVVGTSKVGSFVGDLESATLNESTASNVTLIGDERVGGLAGRARNSEGGTVAVTNNMVKNATIVADKDAYEFVGQNMASIELSTNKAENVIISNGSLVDDGVIETGTRSYEVTSAEGLMNVNEIIANTSTAGELFINVKLMDDVDMTGYAWAPINTMFVNFDGNGHTISNLTTSGASAGFYGYLGGGTIKNLTLENVTATGDQVGAFVGRATGKIENCYLKGYNQINWQNDEAEAWGGIGAVSGVIAEGATLNVTIVEGAEVVLNENGIETQCNYVDNLTGYLVANSGTVVNNGTVISRKSIVDGLDHAEAVNTYFVSNANGLETLNAKMADKSAGKNVIVNLEADIDFTGKTWTPVDSHADTKFTMKEINGNGHTISNLTVNGQAMFTRFAGSGDVTVKDITFDNATINSTKLNSSILTVQSYQNVLLDNVDVTNSTITGAYKVAPLIATVYNEGSSTVTVTLKNCDVSNTVVKATTYDFCTTGMVAFVNAGDNDKIEFENCTVTDVKLYAPDDSYKAHAAIYTTGSGTLFDEAEGVTVTNVTFESI